MRMVRIEFGRSAHASQLEKDTADSDAPVTLADQQNINAFSRFNNRADEVIDRLEALKREIEELEEVETEMELMDDEEMVMYLTPFPCSSRVG